MLKVTPKHIKDYSKCPKKTYFEWNKKQEKDIEQTIIETVIKSAYIWTLQRQKLPRWKHIFKWTEQQIVATSASLPPRKRYKQSKVYLTRLSNWYNNYFLTEYYDPGLINVPLSLGLGTHLTLNTDIDIITISNTKIALFDFCLIHSSKEKMTGLRIFNDLEANVKYWSFWKATDTLPSEYIRLYISATMVKPVKITINESMLKNTERIIRHISRGIRDNIFYPSFSEQCTKCAYRQECHI